MSEKKHLPKKVLIIIVVIALVVVFTSCFFLFKKKVSNDTPTQNTQFTSLQTIDNAANAAALRRDYSVDFNGNYVYKSIADISFDKNLTLAQQNQIYNAICGAKDKNQFVAYLIQKTKNDTDGEIITLSNSKYIKSKNGKMLEYGLCYGDRNKSYIYKHNNSGTITIDNQNYSLNSCVSLTGYWLKDTIPSYGDILYIKQNYYYGTVTNSYLVVTYTYQMI